MKSLYRKFVNYLMHTKLYMYALKNIIPYIRFSTKLTKLKGKHYRSLKENLQAGDVLLTTDRKKLTTLLIPGDFSHAAMCVADSGDWQISEMTHDDYTKSALFDICKESDRVVLLRPNLNQEKIKKAVDKCKSLEGAEYDASFDLGIKALYCSELIYQAYEGNSLGANLEDFVGLGRPYISPTGLYHADNLKIVIDTIDI